MVCSGGTSVQRRHKCAAEAQVCSGGTSVQRMLMSACLLQEVLEPGLTRGLQPNHNGLALLECLLGELSTHTQSTNQG